MLSLKWKAGPPRFGSPHASFVFGVQGEELPAGQKSHPERAGGTNAAAAARSNSKAEEGRRLGIDNGCLSQIIYFGMLVHHLSFFSLALTMSADLSSVFIPGLIEELADEEAHNTATLLQHLIQQTHAGRRSRGEEEESK